VELGLKEKVVIVTGGSSNIGRSTVSSFAAEGSKVVIADWDELQAEKVVKEVKDSGGDAIQVKTDVSDWDQVQAMVTKAVEEFGKVDVLVNNAGWTREVLFMETPREQWEKEIGVNLWGVINCTRAVLDHMVKQKYGRIVSISSDAALRGERRAAVYGAAKGGVISFSRTIAREMAPHGIMVNVISPGGIFPEDKEEHTGEMSMHKTTLLYTPEQIKKAGLRYPTRRLGKAQELANAVVFLASDAASFITGQTLSVSGGFTMQ